MDKVKPASRAFCDATATRGSVLRWMSSKKDFPLPFLTRTSLVVLGICVGWRKRRSLCTQRDLSQCMGADSRQRCAMLMLSLLFQTDDGCET